MFRLTARRFDYILILFGIILGYLTFSQYINFKSIEEEFQNKKIYLGEMEIRKKEMRDLEDELREVKSLALKIQEPSMDFYFETLKGEKECLKNICIISKNFKATLDFDDFFTSVKFLNDLRNRKEIFIIKNLKLWKDKGKIKMEITAETQHISE